MNGDAATVERGRAIDARNSCFYGEGIVSQNRLSILR